MVRLLLTLCYALTALPGPGLCCCALRAPEPASAAPAQAEPCCPCCQHESPPASDHQPPSRCGCREAQPDEATLPDTVEPPALSAAPIDAVSHAPGEIAHPDAAPAPAFHEPARLLRVFHLLRC
jgi:hypothetical protein